MQTLHAVQAEPSATGRSCQGRLPGWSSAIIFNAIWLGCAAGNNLLAIIVTALYLPFHGWFFVQKKQEFIFIAGLALVGIVLDSFLTTIGVIEFSQRFSVGPVFITPVWLMCLWLCFATTIHHGFHWLHQRLAIAAVLSVFSVPSSYIIGARLSGSTIADPVQLFFVYACVWGLLFPTALRIAR
jgi:hypothetical protein